MSEEKPQQDGPAYLIQTPDLHGLTQEVMKMPWHQANPLMQFIQSGIFIPVNKEGMDQLVEMGVLTLVPAEVAPPTPPPGDGIEAKAPGKSSKKKATKAGSKKKKATKTSKSKRKAATNGRAGKTRTRSAPSP